MDNIEIWRPIKGYEGLYEVSNFGQVRNLNHRKENKLRIKTPQVSRNGYLTIALFKGGVGRRFFVHRLVAVAFIKNPHNLPEIDHIDTNRINNRVENLRWVTRSENHLNEITRGRNSAAWVEMWKSGRMDHNKKRVIQLTRDGDFVKEWESASAAARGVGAPRPAIIMACSGSKKSCRGYIWIYKEAYDSRNQTTNNKTPAQAARG